MNNSYLKRHEQNIDSADLLINKHGHYASSEITMVQPQSSSLVMKLVREISSRHKEMSFAYEFNKISNQHVVDVMPKDKFTSDEYLLDEAMVTKAFIEAFPDETILFVCDDQHITVAKPTFVAGPAMESLSYEYHKKLSA
ncbi:hypothetical protein SAMN04487996_107226 [Dyadobacter soli]|uniref:Uncharacterized protein n=1 Tax=Dyadobacter soli TaxID=659014 RepID=A0A1G7GEE3_9BACT|nr:hypothetical protein [Dyadobacter soli]SDE86500.1 hypothetical protein SAMN04487996_107226 [Dyadobacter soli]